MPAQIFVSRGQLQSALEAVEEDSALGVVVLEGPNNSDEPIPMEVWVTTEDNAFHNRHRSLVIDHEGQVLGDHELGGDD